MAELLVAGTALGVASSLITFGDVAWRVLKRLKEYNDKAGDSPAIIKRINSQLPVFLNKLEELKLEAGSKSINPQTSLAVAIISCNELIQRLDILTRKLLLEEMESRRKRLKKALLSVYYEKELLKIWEEIENYKTLLIFHFTEMKEAVRKPSAKPIFMVPFEKDPKFVSRTSVIADIEQVLKKQSRIAIAGIGGVGKSQIAIEYCYRFKERYSQAQVLWAHAGTDSKFRQAYKDIARQLLIPGWDVPGADTLQLVYEHLSNAESRWLLVLDNADDAEIFFPSSKMQGRPGGMARHIPHNSHGSVIITTRDARVGRRLSNGEEPIYISQMTTQEAKAMIRSRVSENCCESDLEKVIHKLGFLPLAITQAAAFIAETRITLSKYLDLLDADDSSILSREFDDWRRDSEAANSVIQTWKLTFDQIRRQSSRAADILSLMAVLDRQGLHLSLFRHPDENEAEFLTALGILQSFSLISTEKGGKIFEMHRLIQLATQSWLHLHSALNKLREQALGLISERFPLPNFENRKMCGMLSPHAQAILCNTFSSDCTLQYTKLLNNLGCYEHAQGLYEAAHQKLSRAVKERKRVLGMEHPDTLTSLCNLALTLNQQCKYADAEKMGRQALYGREELLGKENPDTLISLTNLAWTLSQQAKYIEAEEMSRLAVDRCVKVLGGDHINTLRAISNRAVLLAYRGEYGAAEEMSRQILDKREKIFGMEHPDTLTSITNLASALQLQGKYKVAEDMFRNVLTIKEKVLGKEHPLTILVISYIAGSLLGQGKYQEAEEIECHAVKIKEKILGCEHQDTISSITNLAVMLAHQGKHEDAIEMHKRAINIQKKMWGEEHPGILTSFQGLAQLLQHQGKDEEALEMFSSAIKIQKRILGNEHPVVLISAQNLALMLQRQGKYEEALEVSSSAIGIQKKLLGEEHPATLACLNNLAYILQEKGDESIDSAKEMIRRVIAGREKVLGKEHPDTLVSIYTLALLLHKQEKYKDAEDLYQRASTGLKKTLGASHKTTLWCDWYYFNMMQEVKQKERVGIRWHRSLFRCVEDEFTALILHQITNI
ncbi:TPR-like protein, partial [Glonium stellatum]